MMRSFALRERRRLRAFPLFWLHGLLLRFRREGRVAFAVDQQREAFAFSVWEYGSDVDVFFLAAVFEVSKM